MHKYCRFSAFINRYRNRIFYNILFCYSEIHSSSLVMTQLLIPIITDHQYISSDGLSLYIVVGKDAL